SSSRGGRCLRLRSARLRPSRSAPGRCPQAVDARSSRPRPPAACNRTRPHRGDPGRPRLRSDGHGRSGCRRVGPRGDADRAHASVRRGGAENARARERSDRDGSGQRNGVARRAPAAPQPANRADDRRAGRLEFCDLVPIARAVVGAFAVAGVARAARVRPPGPWIAASLFLVTPVLLAQANTSYVDLTFTAEAVAALYLVLRYLETQGRARWFLLGCAGAATALCLGTKA